MELVKAKQTFKSVSKKQVELNAALADREGKKRDSVEFDLPQYQVVDLPALSEGHGPLLLSCLNTAIAQLAKEQFAAMPADWSFVPSVESLTLEALAASFEASGRSGRVLTKESAAKLAAWLTSNLAKLVTGIQKTEPTYTAEQLAAIVGVVGAYAKYEDKSSTFLGKVIMRLNQVAEAVADDEELAESFTEDAVLTNVFDALVKKFSGTVESEITEDAL